MISDYIPYVIVSVAFTIVIGLLNASKGGGRGAPNPPYHMQTPPRRKDGAEKRD